MTPKNSISHSKTQRKHLLNIYTKIFENGKCLFSSIVRIGGYISLSFICPIQTLLKEVKDQKPLVDSLNEVTSALLELVPWRAREGLDRMVTDYNERYRSASDAITQHVDQTGAAILKSQQVRWLSAARGNNTTLLLAGFTMKFVERPKQ